MDSETETDGFFFESDHVALRGNRDYSNIVRTIALLEASKIRLHEQIQDLEATRDTYLTNPECLLEKLKSKQPILKHSKEIRIPELPTLIGTYEFLEEESVIKEEPNSDVKPATVRGRIVDETKPETFNKLWTCEEQRRLEQLLIEYPPEQKEMRRYAKIAQALGNRTPQQVSSRVQKYFQKLYDAGMPIPGRKPKNRRGNTSKMKYFQRHSTFFPSYNVRVNMPDDADFEAEDLHMAISEIKREENDSEEEAFNLSETEKNKRKDKTLYILMELRKEKEQCGESYQPDPMAALCHVCNSRSISVKQWHCRTCHISINKCPDCLITELITDSFIHISHDIVAED